MVKTENSERYYFAMYQCIFECLNRSPEFSLFHCDSYFVKLLGQVIFKAAFTCLKKPSKYFVIKIIQICLCQCAI